MEQMYTVEEAATQFHVSDQTVRQWLRTGKLKATKLGRRWLIAESAIKAKLESASTEEKQ
jgi:excisionase family DNA binding protein